MVAISQLPLITVAGPEYEVPINAGVVTSRIAVSDLLPSLLNIDDTQVIPTGTLINAQTITLAAAGEADDANQGTRTFAVTTTLTGAYDMGTLSSGYFITYNDSTAGSVITHAAGVVSRVDNRSTGEVTGFYPIYGKIYQSGEGLITIAASLFGEAPTLTAGVISRLAGVRVSNPAISGTAIVTNLYLADIPSATGATNNNISVLIGAPPGGPVTASLYVAADANPSTFKTSVSISPAVTDASGTVTGLTVAPVQGAASSGTLRAAFIEGVSNVTAAMGTLAQLYGLRTQARHGNTGIVTTAYSIHAAILNNGAGTMTSGYAIYIATPTNTGTLTNAFGLYIQAQNVGASSFALYSAGATDKSHIAGNLLIGPGGTTCGANAAGVLALYNAATAPSASANFAHLYCADISAGNAALALWQEAVPIAAVGVASTHKVPLVVNGVTYYALVTTVL